MENKTPPVSASSAQLAIKIVLLDAIEKGHTNPSDLIKYMKTDTFEKTVKRCLAMMEETKSALLAKS